MQDKHHSKQESLYVIESNYTPMRMETIQIRFPKQELEEIDARVNQGIYSSRSEAIRTMIREFESIKETIEVFSDPELVKDIEQGLKEMKEGKGIPLEEIREEIRRELDVQSNLHSKSKKNP